ncbi:MCE family protein [Nocardioides daeguensis]|uniref:MCE family protein n=1 Tax=Nocardioides daeguensis TaxID=908359 RepID=A0ABP6UW64_9ACTN|nr:MCE family protein [Nocardioides daeguensis]MBV6725563.1 MCE family protein [Nocardioides daeguensis]MCR1771423.1 MCE family protein [Nocardioides daeguensis]
MSFLPPRRALRGAAGVVAAVVLAGTFSACELQPNDNTLPGQVATGEEGYDVTVVFEQVENLVPNSQVMLDNVTIGTVAKIDVEDWQAKVRLRLLDSVELPADATFSIGQKTLLGAQFVEVATDGSTAADRLAPGATVPVGQTGVRPSTEQVLASASLLLNNGGLSQIATITEEMTTALDQRVPDAKTLIGRMNELLDVLDANKDDMVTALRAMDSLSGTLASERDVVATALQEIGPGMRVLNRERRTLTQALRRTSRAADSAGNLVALNEGVLLSNLEALLPTLTRLGESATEIPEALKYAITVPFPLMTSQEVIRGDYANLFATIDVSVNELAGQFLRGGLLPGLAGGDPLRDPVEAPFGTQSGAAETPGTTDPATPSAPAAEGGVETPAPDTGAPAPAPQGAPVCGLLKQLLGGCR